jgi:hypothetical protein
MIRPVMNVFGSDANDEMAAVHFFIRAERLNLRGVKEWRRRGYDAFAASIGALGPNTDPDSDSGRVRGEAVGLLVMGDKGGETSESKMSSVYSKERPSSRFTRLRMMSLLQRLPKTVRSSFEADSSARRRAEAKGTIRTRFDLSPHLERTLVRAENSLTSRSGVIGEIGGAPPVSEVGLLLPPPPPPPRRTSQPNSRKTLCTRIQIGGMEGLAIEMSASEPTSFTALEERYDSSH